MQEVIQKVTDEEADAFFPESKLVRCGDCMYYESINPAKAFAKCRKLKVYGMFTKSGYCSLAVKSTRNRQK